MNRCFHLTCPICKQLPVYLTRIEHSTKKVSPLIQLICKCTKYPIQTNSLEKLIRKKTVQNIQNFNVSEKLNPYLAKTRYKNSEAMISTFKQKRNLLNFSFNSLNEKIDKHISELNKLKNKITNLFNWVDKFNQDLEKFIPYFVEDFFDSKSIDFECILKNYSAFTLEPLDLFNDFFSKIFKELETKSIESINKMLDSSVPNISHVFINQKEYIKNPEAFYMANYLLSLLVKRKKDTRFLKAQSFRKAHNSSIESVCKLSNGYYVTAGYDSVINLWEPHSDFPCDSFRNAGGSILSICQISNGEIVSGSSDHFVKVWNFSTHKNTFSSDLHKDGVIKVIPLSSGRFASCSIDATIRIWNVDKKYESYPLTGHQQTVESIAELPNDQIISCSLDRTCKIWSISTQKMLKSFDFNSQLLSLDLLQNGMVGVIGPHDLYIFDPEKISIVKQKNFGKVGMFSICGGIKGKIILGTNNSGVVLDYDSLENLIVLRGHEEVVIFVKNFGNEACTASWEGKFFIWKEDI